MRWAEPTAFVRSALPAAPARILEVGAGAGELATELAGAGHEVVAIDPAPGAPNVCPAALHQFDQPAASFDAAVAVISLHHVTPLAESCRRLGELVRPGGLLVVDEFDVERFDRRAARWWLDQGGADSHDRGGHADAPVADPDALVADLRAHLHGVDRLRAALERWFELSEPVRGPYLYRWNLTPGVRTEEERLIAAGSVPATGARLVGARRP